MVGPSSKKDLLYRKTLLGGLYRIKKSPSYYILSSHCPQTKIPILKNINDFLLQMETNTFPPFFAICRSCNFRGHRYYCQGNKCFRCLIPLFFVCRNQRCMIFTRSFTAALQHDSRCFRCAICGSLTRGPSELVAHLFPHLFPLQNSDPCTGLHASLP